MRSIQEEMQAAWCTSARPRRLAGSERRTNQPQTHQDGDECDGSVHDGHDCSHKGHNLQGDRVVSGLHDGLLSSRAAIEAAHMHYHMQA